MSRLFIGLVAVLAMWTIGFHLWALGVWFTIRYLQWWGLL